MKRLFAATHESVDGTKRTCRHVSPYVRCWDNKRSRVSDVYRLGSLTSIGLQP
jgi:hypothetical protein